MATLTVQRPKITSKDLKPALSTPSDPPAPPEQPVSVIDRLIQKNPALADLIDSLDLVVESVTQSAEIVVKTTNTPADVTTPKVNLTGKSLQQIAEATFEPGTSYTEQEAIERLASYTGTSHERASNGIKLMYTQRILSTTATNTYYLTESTPF